ncbi:MAG TPA: hypothetical protein VGV57_05220 [Thermoleophilaceae bacterium]|nr:hypothetical protein [Thermoleophilaceae bacterium]
MARAIVLVASLVFLVLVLGIVLIVLDANPQNGIVRLVTGAAGFLVGPFDGLFILRDAQLETAINWGIAGFVWLIVGLLLAGLLRQAGSVAVRPDGPRGPRRDWRSG